MTKVRANKRNETNLDIFPQGIFKSDIIVRRSQKIKIFQ